MRFKESDILYENGDFLVSKNPKFKGYAVWHSCITHSVLVGTIGWEGAEVLERAKKEADRRAENAKSRS